MPSRPCAYSDDDVLPVWGLLHSGEPAVALGKGWLEKMRKHLQDVTKEHEKTVIRQSLSCRKRAGTAEGSGEDFHQKILDRETPVSVQVFLSISTEPIFSPRLS